ncbi:phage tail protein [Rhodovulum visakhapatnamense]|uniref:Phage tail-like protein n=1 Tax=Rhodovulum visakhapatnamense TaxID=364297 RepID=A0A4R8G2W1_9RHOB|nr:phage tail protein [Rhodovulum visakhapatnamense]TDX32509.1 phage tail-like protein [Rhodovulum visakhapatnamense]
MEDFAPPVAFHFSVSFTGSAPKVDDTAFQEVGGLETRIETTPLQEGGENRFQHQLPEKVAHSNLTLKRALTGTSSGLVTWCKSCLEGGFGTAIVPKDLVVSLLDEEANPVATWAVGNAFPVKWTVAGFDAMKNELALETVELAYLTLERKL